MPAEDGFLVRLRITGGRLSAEAMRRLAEAGRDHGNGLFDLTSRGNLQLRGATQASLPLLLRALDRLGLLDADAAAEAVRNVMISPLAGLSALIDIRAIGAALEARLASDSRLHRLPGKFGFLIDDGGALSLAHAPADVRFDYDGARDAFAMSLGGTAREAAGLGVCKADEIVAIAARLALAFLQLGRSMPEPPRRMRDLAETCGAAAIAAAADLPFAPSTKRAPADEPIAIGLLNIGRDAFCFGVGAPFGRFSAGMLETVATAAMRFAEGEIRLTPWRALLLARVEADRDEALRRHFGEAFLIDRSDPRLAVAACGGAPACARATTPTHADALALAPLARRLQASGVALHVSGCAKGCARQAPTPYALIGEAGAYDLCLDGAPFDFPGARGLSLGAARDLLDQLAAARHAGAERKKS
jgi:precorrin-3B synthase